MPRPPKVERPPRQSALAGVEKPAAPQPGAAPVPREGRRSGTRNGVRHPTTGRRDGYAGLAQVAARMPVAYADGRRILSGRLAKTAEIIQREAYDDYIKKHDPELYEWVQDRIPEEQKLTNPS